MENKPTSISKVLDENLAYLQEAFHQNNELIFRSITILMEDKPKVVSIVYFETIVDKKSIQEYIMRPLLQIKVLSQLPLLDMTNTIEISKVKTVIDINEVMKELTSGSTAIFIDGVEKCVIADTANWNDRSLSPPQSQRVLKGPQVGFTEIANNNISLIKRIIKNDELSIEDQTLGEETNTKVFLMYLANKVDPEILENVRNKVKDVHLESVLDSSYIEEVTTDDQLTPFPLALTTERPDVTSGHLLEGKIAIICDGSPNVLLVPALFIQFFQSPEDYYGKSRFDLTRFIRIFSFITSIYLIPFYVAYSLFNHELIPSELLISLAAQRQNVPLPVVIEVLLLMLIFEVLLESSIRLPMGITLAFSIIGTIILGQSAAEAGIVQLATLVVLSATYVLNFAVPIHPFGKALKLIRYIMVFLASIYGLYGIILGTIVLINHLCGLNSFGVPYLSPITPVKTVDLKDTFFRFPLRKIINTPKKYSKDDLLKNSRK